MMEVMMNFYFFKRYLFFIAFCSFFTTTQALFINNPYSSDAIITNIITDVNQKLHLKNLPRRTQTSAYLDRPDLRANLDTCFKDKVLEIGSDFFKTLFESILKNEAKLADNYRVFYHGQKREFLLLQDIYR